MLPRSFRRSAQRWVVNATTLAALMGSVWISAHQRLLPMRDDNVAPAAAGTGTGQPVAPVNAIDRSVVTAGANAAVLNGSRLDGSRVRRVSFSDAIKP